MQSSIIDKFSDLILAVKDDEILKQKLIDICKLPTQQRIVEIEKFRFENPGLPLTSVFQLFKNDLIVNEVVKYLSGEKNQDTSINAHPTGEKKNHLLIIIISLLAVIIILLVFLLYSSKDGNEDKKSDASNISSIVLPPNYKQSVMIDYKKIVDEDNPELRKKLIKKFLSDFPNSDYTEDVRVRYLHTLFQLKDYPEISLFLKTYMDFNSKSFFQKIDVLLENKYYEETKRLLTEQMTLNYDAAVKIKLKIYLADIYFYEKKFDNALQTYFEILKSQDVTDAQITKIFFNLSNIYSSKNDSNNLENILNNLINSTSNPQFKTLGLMMFAEYYYYRNKFDKSSSICNKILGMSEQKITYVLFNEKIYTSHSYANFLLTRLN